MWKNFMIVQRIHKYVKYITKITACRSDISSLLSKNVSATNLNLAFWRRIQDWPNTERTTAVFFNVFALVEPSTNVCVAYGTLCNDSCVYTAATAYHCGCEFRPRKFRCVSAEPLTTTRGNLSFRGTPVKKH